jgi:hypothetical protein
LLAEFARGREPEPANDVSPRAPAQRRLRSDISASDDAHAIRINRLRPTFNNLKRSGDLPTTALGRYHALFEVEPEKVNAIGKRSTFCAILEDRNPRVLRLIALGRVEPYWRDDYQNSPS